MRVSQRTFAYENYIYHKRLQCNIELTRLYMKPAEKLNKSRITYWSLY